MFTSQQKSQLAKLLATENLSVQHQKIATAKFDPQNRVLYLPVWQDMSSSLYDLLVGHEVGHALFTPAEGWHDAVTGPKKGKNYKHFLNVVEDARIEKKVQRKYPGLKREFNQAYKELIDRDFFGTKGLDINALSFIDRLNIFSKSQWTNNSIFFTEEESEFVKQVQSVETWNDVLRVTEVIFEYSKEEQKEIKTKQFEQMVNDSQDDEDEDDQDDGENGYGDDLDDDSGYYDDQDDRDEFGDADDETVDEYGESDDETDDDLDTTDGGTGDSEDDSEDESENESEEGDSEVDGEEGDESDEEEEKSSQINRFKDSESGESEGEDDFEPTCQTDEAFRSNETSLVDIESKDVVYVNIPKPNLDYIITPAKRVHELNDQQLNEFIKEGYVSSELPGKLLQEFKSRNEKYIGLLAKEFEMRKAARAYNKSKISDTGDIDVSKLASYKFDDNIFRKMMVIPKGKSHGLVLLLDKSGSMRDNMAGSIEQILVLTMFCRKVNIPFVVYGFGSNDYVKRIDLDFKSGGKMPNNSFTQNLNELAISDVYLREYLNSSMSNAEFTRAIKHMLVIKKSYERKKRFDWKNIAVGSYVPIYKTEELYNTPLTEALIATAEVIKDFKKKNNLDITNLVIVHDGDADNTNRYWREDFGSKINARFNFTDSNFYLQDVKNNFVEKIDVKYESVYELVLNWFNKTTDSKIFGFFICDTGHKRDIKNAIGLRYYVDGVNVGSLQYKNFYLYDKTMKEKIKKLKAEKFLESQSPGFESFFLIAGGDDLNTDNEGLEVLGKVTKKSLVKAFTQLNKKKAVNRVLVSRFIQGIAA